MVWQTKILKKFLNDDERAEREICKIKFEKFNFMMNERSERKGGFINGRKKSS